jgi:hypothetical protein
MPKFVRSIRLQQPSLGINNNQNNYLFINNSQSPLLKMNYTTNNNQSQNTTSSNLNALTTTVQQFETIRKWLLKNQSSSKLDSVGYQDRPIHAKWHFLH